MSRPGAARARVGVVIVHFGEEAPTRACLAALRRDRSRADRRVVVVDNGGALGAGEWHGAELVPLGGNPGFGAGVNAGVAVLGAGPFAALVVLNNDIEVANGYLDAAVDAVGRAGVGLAAGPLRLDRPGGPLWYAGGSVNWLTGTVRQATSAAAAARERTVGFISGAAFAAGAEAWRRVGGFDPSYFLYNEDVDLCLRLRRGGWRLLFAPAMVAVHRLGAVTGSRSRSPFYLEHMAATRLRPFRPLAYRLYLAVLHSGYAGLRALWYRGAVRGDAGRAAAAAILRGHRRALGRLAAGPRVD
ncbi:MAG: glycosyltransferase family 2 protein [Acidobacteria bacterium]|nr:MAG: glycosyltransferase family 2 protein [Acidobacteriota bacterium]